MDLDNTIISNLILRASKRVNECCGRPLASRLGISTDGAHCSTLVCPSEWQQTGSSQAIGRRADCPVDPVREIGREECKSQRLADYLGVETGRRREVFDRGLGTVGESAYPGVGPYDRLR